MDGWVRIGSTTTAHPIGHTSDGDKHLSQPHNRQPKPPSPNPNPPGPGEGSHIPLWRWICHICWPGHAHRTGGGPWKSWGCVLLSRWAVPISAAGLQGEQPLVNSTMLGKGSHLDMKLPFPFSLVRRESRWPLREVSVRASSRGPRRLYPAWPWPERTQGELWGIKGGQIRGSLTLYGLRSASNNQLRTGSEQGNPTV